jgi:hypothetical protein
MFAAGNSDGDLQMLQWTTLNSGPRFGPCLGGFNRGSAGKRTVYKVELS